MPTTYVQAYSESWLRYDGFPERHSFRTVKVQREGSRVLFESRWHAVRNSVFGEYIIHNGLQFSITTSEET